MILTLAGRRIDALDVVEKRFPLENAEKVRQEIRWALTNSQVSALVCAAACGADLLALEVAGELGIRRHIVLPYDHSVFRASSVVNCPGDWGLRFDRIISDVEAKGDLIVYNYNQGEEAIYFAMNHDILDSAEEVAEEMGQELAALVVWNGVSRGADDVTGHFLEEARARGLHILEINTLHPRSIAQ